MTAFGTPAGGDIPLPAATAPQTSPEAVDLADRALAGLDDRGRVAQLSQVLYGWDLVERRGTDYRLSDIGRRIVRDGPGLGSVYGLFRADPWSGRDWDTGVVPQARAEVAQMIQEEIRAASGGIPALIVEEAPHGLQALGAPTLPTLLGQAATWDPDLVREASDLVSRATRADGINAVLVSGLDLLRDPRWGRSEECPGESPRLVSDIARALVLGFQGEPGTTDLHQRAGVVMKHYAGQGDYAGGRNSGSAPIGPRELAEIHLPPCAAAVEAGAVGLMAAYNDIDGLPCVANSWLLDELLRGRWGWDGVVMADALSVDRLAETMAPEAAALTALTAGLDVNMGDECWSTLFGVAERHRDVVGRAAGRMLRVKARLGLLDDRSPETSAPQDSELEQVSARMARESVTLLRGTCEPVPSGARTVVVGEHAADPMVMLGDYVSPRRPGVDCSLAAALSERFGASVVDLDAPDLEERLAGADVVVCQVGGTSERRYSGTFRATGASELTTTATCGEGVDLAELRLPHAQDEFVRRVRGATRGRLIVVAVMGRPHILTEVADHADDLLVAWYPGPHGGAAVGDLLAGDADPRGRLPVTLLRHPGVVPWHDDDRVGRLEPGYVDVDGPALFLLADGHGRHRTRLLDHAAGRTADGGLRLEITCSADVPGNELISCFVRRLGSPLWPRRRELVAHERIDVGPDPTTVTLHIPAEALFGPGDTRCVVTVPVVDVSVDLEADEGGAR